MQKQYVTFEEVLAAAEKLSQEDKERLVEHLSAELPVITRSHQPKVDKTLRGLWADLGPAPSAEEIDEARKEAWKNFPREDI